MRTESDTPCVEEKACRRKGMPGRGGVALCVAPSRAPRLRDTVGLCFLTSCLFWASNDTLTPEVALSLQVGPDAWMAPLDKSCFKTHVPVLISLNQSPRGGQSHVSLDHRLPGRCRQQRTPPSNLGSGTHEASWPHVARRLYHRAVPSLS